jgi:hypothetical protein
VEIADKEWLSPSLSFSSQEVGLAEEVDPAIWEGRAFVGTSNADPHFSSFNYPELPKCSEE